jgi:hypothetical protein
MNRPHRGNECSCTSPTRLPAEKITPPFIPKQPRLLQELTINLSIPQPPNLNRINFKSVLPVAVHGSWAARSIR